MFNNEIYANSTSGNYFWAVPYMVLVVDDDILMALIAWHEVYTDYDRWRSLC